MAEDRLPVVREMILASGEEERRAALDRLLPMQQSDFEGIFEAMAGLPVTIRLLDPPLHEFLPPLEEATDERMRDADQGAAGGEPDARHARLPARPPVAGDLRDAGAGDRPRRAAVEERTGEAPLVEIMHPLVGFAEELQRLRAIDRRDRRTRRRDGRVPRRHDDRAAARVRPGRRDRRARRLLLVRDERPDADGARLLARRRGGQVPDALPRGRHARAQPVRDARPGAASAT